MNDSSSSRAPTSRNVARAVARSRAVRASVARRRRRLAVLVACAAATVGVPIAWIMAEPAAAVAASAVSEVQDLAELLGQRSPGTRTQAELTKHARVAAKSRTQPKPAGPAGRPGEPGIPATTALVDLLQPPIAPIELMSGVSPPPFAPPPGLNAILASPPVDTAFTPPTDNSGPIHFPTSEPRDELPVSAVPEPGTWAMMLVGFGLIGWRMRRRRGVSAAKSLRRAAN